MRPVYVGVAAIILLTGGLMAFTAASWGNGAVPCVLGAFWLGGSYEWLTTRARGQRSAVSQPAERNASVKCMLGRHGQCTVLGCGCSCHKATDDTP